MPWNLSSEPIGSCTGTGLAFNRAWICSYTRMKSAPGAVHLVDEDETRNAVLVGLAPHRLGLRLDAADRAQHGARAVEHAQAALDLDREIDVARACL